MTITYNAKVANSFGFGNFWKLLFKWRGSVYKLVWPEMIAYIVIYSIISIVYRIALNAESQITFEKVVIECNHFSQLIPVSFVLGFYVSLVVARWWDQYNSTPWPDTLCILLSTSIEGHDKQSRLMRRTIARYANLSFTMTFIMISTQAKKRFPTTEHLIEAGLLEENELNIFRKMDNKSEHPKYWMPLVWAGTIVKRARKEGRIKDDFAVRAILDEINKIRSQCGALLGYDWINVPLVYTQVVTLAVYTYFLTTIMGRQFLDPSKTYSTSYHDLDYYVPIFTLLEFFFYMGWLKVAESLLNPFGEDDDDFETNFLIDRNLQVAYLIVDEMHEEHPKLIQDKFWDEGIPSDLPYTKAAEEFIIEIPQGSTAEIEISEEKQEILPTCPEEPSEDEFLPGHTRSFKRLVSSKLLGQKRRSTRKRLLEQQLSNNISNDIKKKQMGDDITGAAVNFEKAPVSQADKQMATATQKSEVKSEDAATETPSVAAAAQVQTQSIPQVEDPNKKHAGPPRKRSDIRNKWVDVTQKAAAAQGISMPPIRKISEWGTFDLELDEQAERDASAW